MNVRLVRAEAPDRELGGGSAGDGEEGEASLEMTRREERGGARMDAVQEKASSATISRVLGDVLVVIGSEAEDDPASGSYSSPTMKTENTSPPLENADRKKSGVFDPETAVSLLNPAKPAAAALRPTPTPIRG